MLSRGGRLYYSTPLVWISAATLVLAAPAALFALHTLDATSVSLSAWAPFWRMLDLVLATTLLSGALWHFMVINLTPGFLHSGRPELYALRAASAMLVACGAVCLVAQLLPRPVLAACATLFVGVSINFSCWWAALWLHLQNSGGFALLPRPVRHALKNERLVDLLRRDVVSLFFARCRQLLPLLVLPDDELECGLALLPPTLRARLERRGLAHALLPDALCELLEPWEQGPDYLCVRPLRLAMPWRDSSASVGGVDANSAGFSGSHRRQSHSHHLADGRRKDDAGSTGKAQPPDLAAAAPPPPLQGRSHAPEWLLLIALRRHVLGALRAQLRAAPCASAIAVGALATAFGGRMGAALRLSPRQRQQLVTRLSPPLMAVAVICICCHYNQHIDRRRRGRNNG